MKSWLVGSGSLYICETQPTAVYCNITEHDEMESKYLYITRTVKDPSLQWSSSWTLTCKCCYVSMLYIGPSYHCSLHRYCFDTLHSTTARIVSSIHTWLWHTHIYSYHIFFLPIWRSLSGGRPSRTGYLNLNLNWPRTFHKSWFCITELSVDSMAGFADSADDATGDWSGNSMAGLSDTELNLAGSDPHAVSSSNMSLPPIHDKKLDPSWL